MALSRTSATQPASALAESLDAALARISEMNIEQLRVCWRETFASDPPAAFSKDLLARAICHRLQEQAFGGLSASTGRLLRSLSQAGRRTAAADQGWLHPDPRASGRRSRGAGRPGRVLLAGKPPMTASRRSRRRSQARVGTAPGSSGSDQRRYLIRRRTRPPVGLLLTATASPNLRCVRRLPVGPVAAPACQAASGDEGARL